MTKYAKESTRLCEASSFKLLVCLLKCLFYKQLMYKKRVLDWSKNKATFVLCSRKIKKLCNIKKKYNDLLPLVNFMIFVVQRL